MVPMPSMKAAGDVLQKRPMTLEFITVSNPKDGKSLETRRRVKKHVMKDIGRSRRRPKKNPVVLDVVLSPHSSIDPSPIDAFASWPMELGQMERFWISYIFSEHDNPQKAFRNEWLPLGQIDAATLLIILSNSAAHQDQIKGVPHGQRGLDSEKFHLRALQSLNQRLLKPEPEVSDGILGAITGFIVHNEIIADFEQWEVHLEGLTRLIGFRGGIDAIGLRELRETISWIETRGCLPQDRRPYFPIPPTWLDRFDIQARAIQSYNVPAETAAQWSKLAPRSTASLASFDNLFRMSTFMKRLIKKTQGKIFGTDEYAGGWPAVLIHTLLSRYNQELFSIPPSPAQEAFRLATLLYLVNVWRKFGVGPIRTYHLAGLLLDACAKDVDWKGCRAIQAWALLMGVIVNGDPDLGLVDFMDEFQKLASDNSMTVRDLIFEARDVLWIEGVFPTVDAILEESTMDWVMKRCLTENRARLTWDIATLSLETRLAIESRKIRVVKDSYTSGE